MQVTEETKQHAQEVLDYILEHPKQHNQKQWWDTKNLPLFPTVEFVEENICNTTMCAAGTSVFLKQGVQGLIKCDTDVDTFIFVGAKNLGLDEDEAQLLFLDTAMLDDLSISNETAVNMLRAVASGDADKFEEAFFTGKEADYAKRYADIYSVEDNGVSLF